MSFNLRLPADLDLMARAKSEGLGISLNALICVALGEYLKGSNDVLKVSRRPLAGASLGTNAKYKPAPEKSPLPSPGQKLSKAERREITANARLARKA